MKTRIRKKTVKIVYPCSSSFFTLFREKRTKKLPPATLCDLSIQLLGKSLLRSHLNFILARKTLSIELTNLDLFTDSQKIRAHFRKVPLHQVWQMLHQQISIEKRHHVRKDFLWWERIDCHREPRTRVLQVWSWRCTGNLTRIVC